MAAEPQAEEREPRELRVELGADVDEQQLDAMTTSLRRQLLELDVETVERVAAGPAPEGAKAIETLALGALVVKLVARRETLAGVAGLIRSWLGSRPDRTARLRFGEDEVELTGLSPEQQERLIASWLERQAGG
jgi:hypothetical protein